MGERSPSGQRPASAMSGRPGSGRSQVDPVDGRQRPGTDDEATEVPSSGVGARAGGDRRRMLWSLAALAALYGLIVLAGDPRAASGSDAGGKLATVAHMASTGSWDPDVGYWASSGDPDGRFHPLIKTSRYGDRWVQVTSLPMIYAAVPLWSAGGAAATLALPAIGGLLAAWGARRLALALGATRGWGALWLVGAGSPVVFYVADLWEHAIALGLFVAALAPIVDPGQRSAVRVACAGMVLGVAATLRPELALYLVALVVVGVALREVRQAWVARWPALAAAAALAGIVVVLNSFLERAVLASGVQSTRVGSQLGAAGSAPAERAGDALLTTVGLLPSTDATALVLGVTFVAGLVVLGLELRRPSTGGRRWVGTALVVVGAIVRLGDGVGFVPGTLSASPMAPAGLVAGDGARQRLLVGTAVAALPLVWMLQWQGDLLAQWAGRYTLASGVLLTVVAAVAAERTGWRRPAAATLVGVTVALSVFGVLWHVQRTTAVAEAFDRFEQMSDDSVFVTWYAHLPREGGAWYPSQRWLRAERDDVSAALEVASTADAERVVLVEPLLGAPQPGPAVPGWVPLEQSTVPWLSGTELLVTTYGRAPS